MKFFLVLGELGSINYVFYGWLCVDIGGLVEEYVKLGVFTWLQLEISLEKLKLQRGYRPVCSHRS